MVWKQGFGPVRWYAKSSLRNSGKPITPGMCASCCSSWVTRCNGHHAAGAGRSQATAQMGPLYLPESKKNAKSEGAVIVFEDEASFRQTPTLHATWAKRGSQPQIPTRGERHTQKISEPSVWTTPVSSTCIRKTIFSGRPIWLFWSRWSCPPSTDAATRIYLIQDNASYHKKQETYAWFKANRRYLEVFQLPPYWPELNATERIWNYTRKYVT